jgi:hypothetical protein
MNYSKDEYGNIIISDGVRKFTFMNMGDYVGHDSREWYEEAPAFYKLMMYDEIHDNDKLHVEALVDTLGNYQRILVDTGTERRSLNIRGNSVDSDAVYIMDDKMFPKESYISYERDTDLSKPVINIKSYLSEEHTFTNKNGQTYDGPLKNDNIINAFISSDKELLPSVNEYVKSEENTL